MNIMVRTIKLFAKIYMDNIVIRFRFFDNHISHSRVIFEIFIKNNISIKSIKMLLKSSSVTLLDQKVNALILSTIKQKFKTL